MNRLKNGNLDDEAFMCQEREGLILYLPSHVAAVANASWCDSNLWFRSRIEDKDDRTVSQGFGKFFNLGQGPDGLRVDIDDIVASLRDGKSIMATLKYDGSCLIRSVHDGEVIFRTRGSFSYEHHDSSKEELQEFMVRYPQLANPEFYPNGSLLFEWVTPANQIVIKYEKPELHLIGGIDHGHRHVTHLRYLTMSELMPISAACGVKLVEHFTISSVKEWYDFYNDVIHHREIEGYVLRLGENQSRLVKVKSEPYLTKHGLKSNLSFKSMVEFWLQHGAGQSETIVKQLETLYDEEVVMWALPYVLKLEDAIDQWEKAYNEVRSVAISSQHWSRKDFAIEMQKRYKEDRILFSLAMVLWQDPDAEPQHKLIRNFMERLNLGDGIED